MKVDINLSRDVKEPYVVIHTNGITNEISELANTISEISEKGSAGRIIGNAEDTMIILEAETISVIRVDNEKVLWPRPRRCRQGKSAVRATTRT